MAYDLPPPPLVLRRRNACIIVNDYIDYVVFRNRNDNDTNLNQLVYIEENQNKESNRENC